MSRLLRIIVGVFAVFLSILCHILVFESNFSYERTTTESVGFYSPSDIRVMSFNIRNSNLDHGETTRWHARRDYALGVVKRNYPDIIGLQEANPDQLRDLVALGYISYGEFGHTSLLYLPTFRCVDSGTAFLSSTPYEPMSVSWDASQPRAVTWILMEYKGKKIIIVDTHLDHVGEVSRHQSCHVILSVLEQGTRKNSLDSSVPVILMGDFNNIKYSNVWDCFAQNGFFQDSAINALHVPTNIQYTFHSFHGIHLNSWWWRTSLYIASGFSCVLPHLWRHKTGGVACVGTPLWKTLWNRLTKGHRAGVHHIDWILYKHLSPQYFAVITDHYPLPLKSHYPWNPISYFHDRIIDSVIHPSDHFPIIAGFNYTH